MRTWPESSPVDDRFVRDEESAQQQLGEVDPQSDQLAEIFASMILAVEKEQKRA